MKINKYISSYNQSSRNGQSIKYIVIHYVGAVSSAKNNCIYFSGGNRNASAHFFVDSEIWQCIPENMAAWHCGGGLQDTGKRMNGGNYGASLYRICTNQNSIGIELCCKVENGKVVPRLDSIEVSKELVAYLMKKYNVPKENVIRHFDVTGKICPNGYINKDSWRWLHSKLTSSSSSNTQSIPRGNLKSIDEVAREVINGRWGNGADRAQKLRNAGYNYDLVQKRVNEILSGNKPKLKSIDEIAREVINGKWGNGSDRVNRLKNAGYDYNAVQRRVNEILR